jgi:hypothetical protein
MLFGDLLYFGYLNFSFLLEHICCSENKKTSETKPQTRQNLICVGIKRI